MSGYNEIFDVQKQLISTGFKPEAVKRGVEANSLYLTQRSALIDVYRCTSCNLVCPNKVPGAGNMDSPVMILGGAPGKDELETGVPFTGAAGTALIMMLEALRVYRGRVYMTNAVHCNNIDESTGKLMAPTKNSIDVCRKFLMREIAIQQPKVILSLGNPALWSITNQYDKEISQVRGIVSDLDESLFGVKARVIFSWHPSYMISQSGDMLERIKQDLWTDITTAFMMARHMSPSYQFDKRPIGF